MRPYRQGLSLRSVRVSSPMALLGPARSCKWTQIETWGEGRTRQRILSTPVYLSEENAEPLWSTRELLRSISHPQIAHSIRHMVGERGFEPPTPWSRTRCSTRLSHSPNLRLEGRLRAERLLADAFVNARELQQSVSEDRAPTSGKPYTAMERPLAGTR